ncbi:uncharacterized protein LOC106478779 [Limulus polyphemus]|uniref:L-serine ammonia-lyase n=1 Tax=Limulus polyphemus TaxID=6850 RepID=A0ABM1C5Y4_LIMPO|nr:uncharacterized protein LOC106478779 [Limulus polyphemus]
MKKSRSSSIAQSISEKLGGVKSISTLALYTNSGKPATSSKWPPIDLPNLVEGIINARKRICHHIVHTAMEYSPVMSQLGFCKVFIKMENDQRTGSFKIRGALNKLMQMKDEDITSQCLPILASTGNHALACAHAFNILNIYGKILVPENINSEILSFLRTLNANVQFYGSSIELTEAKARLMASEEGRVFISSYNDLDIICGQGTVAIDIIEDMPEVDIVIVPVGGGGLISGIAAYLKQLKPQVKVIGCQPEKAAILSKSVKVGYVIKMDTLPTLAHSTNVKLEQDSVTLNMCAKLVDEWVLVSEEEIATAVYYMMEHHHRLVEGASGVAIAGFQKTSSRYQDKTVVIISCGSNISMKEIKKIVEQNGPGDD